MPHLWKNRNPDGWTAIVLDAPGCALDAGGDASGGDGGERRAPGACAALIRPTTTPIGKAWVLLASPDADVAVNGDTLRAGIAVLRDRDEIRLAAATLFFSTQHAVVAEELTGGLDPGFRCARCRRRLEPGATIVRCPGCGIVYHESDELPCWSYADKCTLCPEPTQIGDAHRWSPEDL